MRRIARPERAQIAHDAPQVGGLGGLAEIEAGERRQIVGARVEPVEQLQPGLQAAIVVLPERGRATAAVAHVLQPEPGTAVEQLLVAERQERRQRRRRRSRHAVPGGLQATVVEGESRMPRERHKQEQGAVPAGGVAAHSARRLKSKLAAAPSRTA